MPRSLAEFVEVLAAAGELQRVPIEVDADLEIAEITRRVAASGGPAILFERVRDRLAPVVTNLLGTLPRACRGLGIAELDELDERLRAFVATAADRSWLDRIRLGSADVEKYRPKSVKSAVCQQVVRLGRDIDFAQWPFLRQWPQESSASLTSALVVSQHPETQVRSVEPLLIAVLDNQRLAIIDESFSGFGRHLQTYATRGEKMPLALILGGDPVCTIASRMTLPEGIDGYHFAGLLRGTLLEVIKGRTQPIDVPADAEVIIEGMIDPAAPHEQVGIAAWATGHCHPARGAAVVEVTTVTHRTRPLVPAIVLGTGDGELAVLQQFRDRMLLPVLQAVIPELRELAFPTWGGLQAFAVAAVHKTFPQQARKVASALWGHAASMNAKCVVLVDEHVDVRSTSAVLAVIGANVNPARDVFFHTAPGNTADHASLTPTAGSCMAIDATAKLPGEQDAPWPARLTADAATQALVEERLDDYGLFQRH